MWGGNKQGMGKQADRLGHVRSLSRSLVTHSEQTCYSLCSCDASFVLWHRIYFYNVNCFILTLLLKHPKSRD